MHRKLNILVVDDDKNQATLLAEALQRMGHTSRNCYSAKEAVEMLRHETFHVVITDFRMPETDGLQFLKSLKESEPDVEVLLVTAYASVSSAVSAIKFGALDYLEKPIDLQLLSGKLRTVEEKVSLKAENKILRARLEDSSPNQLLLGKNKEFLEVVEQVRLASQSDASVLLLGESGTGKEVLAKLLHRLSKRKNGPLVPINCGAIPENLVESEFFGHVKGAFTGADKSRAGLIEEASGGTVFLDEIGELPLSMQPKLLRILQEGNFCRIGSTKSQNVDVRWVFATNKDLSEMVVAGTFRKDLFYRLAVIPIKLPPLRERPEDVPEFAVNILERKSRQYNNPVKEISSEAMEALSRYSWPGNFRELENTVERLLIMVSKPRIELEHLPREITENRRPDNLTDATANLGEKIENLERDCIIRALDAACGNQSEAARYLGLQERTLRYKMRKLGIPSAKNA